MRFTDLLSTPSGAAWVPLADAVVKATLLFAAAGFVSFALRRGSAAARHLVWILALVSALALPVLSVALPHWQIPIVTLTSASAPPAASGSPDEGPMMQAPARRSARAATQTGSRESAVPAAEPAPRGSSLPQVSWPVLAFLAWATGAAVILLRLVAGMLAVQWMSRHTERVTDAPWLPLARSLASELGISPRIIFLRSGRAAMPMAWGVLSPAVLMPSDADTWPAERLRIVLLHELAHVKRRDCLTHMVGQISCALHWFNPLAWVAARHVRTERERACDDLVLAAGTRGPDYADQLLEIARVMRSGRLHGILAGASLAMARRSQLEGRLMAILDPTVPRAGVSRVRTAAATTLFACALMPLAAVQPWTTAATDDQQPQTNSQAGAPLQTAASQAPAQNREAVPDTARDTATQPPSTERRTAPPPAALQDVSETAVTAALEAVRSSIDNTARGLQGGVRAQVDSGVQSGLHSTIGSAVVSALGAIDSDPDINTNINTNVDTNVNANVNRHGGGNHDGGADQDARGKATDPRTVAALTAALKDSDKEVRETALQALVQLRDPGIFEPLVQALSDAAADVREQAVFGLGQLRDRRAVEPLTRALKDQNADVREQAAFALGQLRDRSAVPALTAALKDAADDVREQAVFALGQLRDPAAFDALAAATRDSKPDVRHQAVFALGELRDHRGVEPLVSALKDADADVREQAAFALGQIRDPRAVEALVIALKDAVADVREQAAFALGQLRDPRAIDGLTAALKDTSADVRQQAAFALGQLAR